MPGPDLCFMPSVSDDSSVVEEPGDESEDTEDDAKILFIVSSCESLSDDEEELDDIFNSLTAVEPEG